MRHSALDVRSSLLDIKVTPNNRPPSTTTVIRMHIQPRDGLRWGQRHRQLQLCVPLVVCVGVWQCPAMACVRGLVDIVAAAAPAQRRRRSRLSVGCGCLRVMASALSRIRATVTAWAARSHELTCPRRAEVASQQEERVQSTGASPANRAFPAQVRPGSAATVWWPLLGNAITTRPTPEQTSPAGRHGTSRTQATQAASVCT
jgi:hypothetical protein